MRRIYLEPGNLPDGYKLYYSYPVTTPLLVCGTGDETGVMPTSWQTPLSYNPPLLGVAVSPKRYTYTILKRIMEFTINYLPHSFSQLAKTTGTTSGRRISKQKEYNIRFSESRKVKTPTLEDSYAAYECTVMEIKTIGDHDLLIGKIVNISFKENTFTPNGSLNMQEIKPMLYLGNLEFVTTDDCSRVKY